jgi:hypothetical protein
MNTMTLAISKIQGDYISKIVLKMSVQFHWIYHKLAIKQFDNFYLEIVGSLFFHGFVSFYAQMMCL